MRTEVNRVYVCQLLSVRDIEEWVQPKRKIHRKELKNDCHCVGALEDETFVRAGWRDVNVGTPRLREMLRGRENRRGIGHREWRSAGPMPASKECGCKNAPRKVRRRCCAVNSEHTN